MNNNVEELNKITEYFVNSIKDLNESNIRQENVRHLLMMMNRLRDFLRESYQHNFCKEIENTIEALKKKTLNPEQNDLLQNLIIGDAKFYLDSEKNCNEWINILKEEVQNIQNLKDSENPNSFIEIYGRSLKLQRILEDLNFYTEQKNRINNFTLNTNDGISKEEAECLIDVLKRKLESPEC